AGKIGPVPPSGTGKAGSFPFGCFDPDGNQLGPDSFVPGYTQVYAFEDGRVNANPRVLDLDIAPGGALDQMAPIKGGGEGGGDEGAGGGAAGAGGAGGGLDVGVEKEPALVSTAEPAAPLVVDASPGASDGG